MAWNPGFPGAAGGWDPNATTTTGSTGWTNSQSWSQSQSTSQGFASWPAENIRPQVGGHPTASGGMSHSFSSSQLCHRPGFQEHAAPGGSRPSSGIHMPFQPSHEEHRQISRTTER